MGICSEENCGGKTKAKGLCQPHYYKKYTLPKRRKGRRKNYIIMFGGDYSVMNIRYKNGIIHCLIDNEDVNIVSSLSWHFIKGGYVCHTFREGSKTSSIRLHNLLMGNMETDHKNHDTLDNRKVNLRVCNKCQNQWNRRLGKNNISGVKGVSKDHIGRWKAQLNKGGKIAFIKYFLKKEDANNAIIDARAKYHGDFACNG